MPYSDVPAQPSHCQRCRKRTKKLGYVYYNGRPGGAWWCMKCAATYEA